MSWYSAVGGGWLFALGVISLIASLCLGIRRWAAVGCWLFASGGLALSALFAFGAVGAPYVTS